MNEARKKHMTLVALGLLGGSILGFFLGWIFGFGTAVKAIADVAGHFIEIDHDMVYKAITQYKLNINGGFNG